MIDEGYIKYQCNWIKTEPIAPEKIQELNQWRNKLYDLGLIGQYENGIGYGNISIRDGEKNQFIVSGTQTGGMVTLTEQHYTIVTDYNWSQNYLTCQGSIQASSEALTHAAIYEANPQIKAVFHVHHRQLWQSLMNQVPTTRNDAAYGTPEMAKEIIRLCQENLLQIPQILVMSGHEEGIIAFGSSLDETGNILLNYFEIK